MLLSKKNHQQSVKKNLKKKNLKQKRSRNKSTVKMFKRDLMNMLINSVNLSDVRKKL